MGEDSWSFRTNQGVAAVRTGALIVRSTPWLFLTGQYTRFRRGSLWQQIKIGFQVFGLLSFLHQYSQFLREVSSQGPSVNFETGLVVAMSVVSVVMIWLLFFRVQRISLSKIREVNLDTSEGELAVDFERDGKIRQWLGQSDVELELTPRTPDELRKAREILSLRGFSIDSPSQSDRPTNESRSASRETRQRESV